MCSRLRPVWLFIGSTRLTADFTALSAAKGQDGLVIATTLGTGIGTALIYNGALIPNTELGDDRVFAYRQGP